MAKKYYEKHTKYFDKIVGEIGDLSNTTSFKLIRKYIPKSGRVLDVGCGQGNLLYTLSRRGLKAYGVDLSPKRIKQCVKYGLDACLGDATIGLPFKNAFFDVAIVGHVFEHLNKKDRIKIMEEIHRVLIYDGIIIAATPYNQDLESSIVVCPECGKQFNWQGHVDSFKENDMRIELESIGFKGIDEFIDMPIPLGSKLPRSLTIILLKLLIKYNYNVGIYEIVTIAKKIKE